MSVTETESILSEFDQQLQADEAAYWSAVEEAALGHKLTTNQRSAIGEVGKTVGQFRDDVYAQRSTGRHKGRGRVPRCAATCCRDSPQSAQAAGQVGLLQLFAKIIGEYIDKAVIQLDEVAQVQPRLPMCRCTLRASPTGAYCRGRGVKSSRWKTRLQFCKLKWCGANRLTRTQSRRACCCGEEVRRSLARAAQFYRRRR